VIFTSDRLKVFVRGEYISYGTVSPQTACNLRMLRNLSVHDEVTAIEKLLVFIAGIKTTEYIVLHLL
jgi:hypothetical protein